MMVPFADAYITSFSATTDAHSREVAAMVADSALDQARALDATDQQDGCLLLAGRSATAVQNQWDNPAPGASQLLSETAQASDTSQDCPSSSTTPLPASPQTQTVGSQSFAVNYYVGTCWESESTSSSSHNSCTDPSSPPSTDYEMYRVIADVTWSAPRSGCGSSGCDYVTSTLISTTANPSFDVNPTIPYISETGTTFTIDTLGDYQVSSTGFPPPTYSDKAYGNGACSPTQPSWLTLSSSGLISGTPPAGTGGDDYTICLNATNADGTGTQTFIVDVVPIPTSMSIAVNGSGSASVTYGTATTLSDSGLPSAAASGTPPAPTGTVTFTAGGTTLCTATLPATSCTTSTTLVPGTYTVTASYPGDTVYAGNTSSNTATLTVNQVPTSMSITVHGSTSPYTINYGSTATLAETGLPSAATGGTVTFTSGTTTLCTATVSSGAASCSTSSSLAGGAYTVTGTYSGTTIYAGNTSSNTVSLTVDQVPSITSSPSASFTVGSSGSFQMTASGYPAPTFQENSSGSCAALPNGMSFTNAGVLAGTPANGTAGVYSLCFTASNSAGTSNVQTFTLTVNGIATTTLANVSPTTVNSGSNDMLSATVTPSAATGTVTFTSGGTTLCSATLSSGSASCSKQISLAGGSNTVTATYGGNTTYAGSSGTATLTVDTVPSVNSASSATFTVGTSGSFQVTASGYPGATSFSDASSGSCTSTVPSGLSFNTTTGVLSGNPANGTVDSYNICFRATNSVGTSSVSALTLTVNGKATSMSITVHGSTSPYTVNYGSTATLAESGLPSGATGTVTYSSGATTLCTATVSSGSASCATSSTLAAGSYTVTGTYSGDTTYAATTSTNTVGLTVSKYTPAVGVSGSLSGSTITFTATVTGSSSPPTGTISWSGVSCSSTTSLSGSGTTSTATCTVTGVTTKTYTATASYSGDTNYNPATGNGSKTG
jgi:large repetitive protein